MKPIKSFGAHIMILFGSLLILNQWILGAGYEFEGIGARQVSRAGAAIADADDWSAIYWNPGNIINVVSAKRADIGIELFGGESFGKDTDSLSNMPGFGGTFEKDKSHSNFLLGAVGALFRVSEKFGMGMGLYTPLLQGADFKATSSAKETLDLESSATILVGTLSGSYKITPTLSAGAGLNMLYGSIKSQSMINNYLMATNTTDSSVEGDGVGVEGIFGLQFDPLPKLSLGLVYRTGSDVELTGESKVTNTSQFLPDEKSDFTYELRHPPTWGIGSAIRPVEKMTVTLDYNRTLWHRFTNNFVYDTPGSLLVNGSNTFQWKDSWKVRFGFKYAATEKTNLLLGYSHDRSAIDVDAIDFSTSIDVPMNRFSAGWNRQWTKGFDTTLGIIGGSGERTDNGGVDYRLSGYQVMLETRWVL